MGSEVAVGVSEQIGAEAAFAAAAEAAAEELGGPPDLAVVFASAAHLTDAPAIGRTVAERLEPRHLIGCGAGGVVATAHEIEDGPGAVVWAARLPGVDVEVYALHGEPGTDPDEIEGLPDSDAPADAMLMLADPYSFAADAALERLNAERPGTPVIGGLASAAIAGRGALFLGEEVSDAGAVVARIAGAPVLPCVSQGARPIGPEIAITAAEDNVITELAFKPAIERIGEVVSGLPEPEREELSMGMLIGVVIDENRPEHERGDFLVRPVVGADRESGAIAIGERVRVGQTIRLHSRDGESADADLREALAVQSRALGDGGAAGALCFTCNGRGRGMFGFPDHDAGAIDDALGVPVGGFFCAGEVGPVAGRNFLHGFTATIAVFPAG